LNHEPFYVVKKNCVFIATSLDGYIADKQGGIEWLDLIPNTNHDDMGYFAFINEIDALVMGRASFETVLGFGIEWPYTKPVFVLSSTLKAIPEDLADRVFHIHGTIPENLERIHALGHFRLYIDGGKTISSFLREDLIDEMIITRIPILLGGGAPLFGDLPQQLEFELISSKTYLHQITQHHYKRKRKA
jgi:dihydrofolate reductase